MIRRVRKISYNIGSRSYIEILDLSFCFNMIIDSYFSYSKNFSLLGYTLENENH